MGSKAIRRVLVANRGEIARRIIRTCHRLGIETVAVFTEVDRHAPFVAEATVSHALGSPDSYLSIEKIVRAAKDSGADAVHPGYGFLSENADFAAACEKASLLLIGPSSETMRKLGSKTSAKTIAQSCNVPTAPTLIFSQDPLLPRADQLKTFADRVGYPVILKAAAGGGGRGMRMIAPESDRTGEIESAEREALKAFGSREIFAERCITPARHIEVQVAADKHGNVVALGTRDCTLQRSNQKILEEGPATQLRAGLTEELCEAACRLAKGAKYSNLGTVEFLYSPEGAFYFLEVNTRLQVEHPVTEMVTGLDLVELQIRLAEGKKLSECGVSSTPAPKGHAIEARLCAEELSVLVAEGGQATYTFAISTGIVQEFEIPTREVAGATVRLDSGVSPCSEVTHYYDSLIAKIIVHAENRTKAIDALREVLSRSRISGIKTNRGLLIHLLSHETFRSLSHTIQGSSSLLPTLQEREKQSVRAHSIAAAFRVLQSSSPWASSSPWVSLGQIPPLKAPWVTATGQTVVTSETLPTESGAQSSVTCGSNATNWNISIDDVFSAQPDGNQLRVQVEGEGAVTKACIRRDGHTTWVHLPDGSVALEERTNSPLLAHSASHLGREVVAHIPGKVAALRVAVGDHVVAGQQLLVLDSMKMEHPIKAPTNGIVKELPLGVGSIVQAGAVLVRLADD